MTLSIKEKVELSRFRIGKAEKFLKAASNLFKGGDYESAVNRSYYAILSASKSILILRGIDPDTHEGIKTMLAKEFIKTDILPKSFGETFRNIQARRIDSDYGDYIEIGKDEALDSLERAKVFVKKTDELSKDMIKELKKTFLFTKKRINNI